MRRNWFAPTDLPGPAVSPRPRLSRRGLGARLVVKSNPVSFTADWLTECVPFLSLSGGQDAASQAARQGALLNAALGGGGAAPGTDGGGNPSTSNTPQSPVQPTTAGPAPTSQGYAKNAPGGGKAPTTGPFGYIGLAQQKRGG